MAPTPGHTPDHPAYRTGDTLFMPDGGTARCDFPVRRDYANETKVGKPKRNNIQVGAGARKTHS